MAKCRLCGLQWSEERYIHYDDGGFSLYFIKYCAGKKYHGYLMEDIPDDAGCDDFIPTSVLREYEKKENE